MVIYTLKPGYFIDFCCKSTCFYQNRTINHQKYGANQTFLLFSLDYSSKCRRFAAFLIHVPTAKQIRFSLIAPPQRQVFNFRLPRLNGRNRGVCSSHFQTVSFLGFAHLHLVVAKIRKRHIYVSAEMTQRNGRDEYSSLSRQIYVPAEMNIHPCQDKYTSLPR